MSEALTVRGTKWVARICSAWQRSVEGILETGRLLCEAKPDMPHGGWLQMIKHELPFGENTSEILMKISRNPQITKSEQIQNLPPSWGTLYELTKLDDGAWALAEDQGLIRPDVQRKQIVAFRKSLVPAKKKPGPPSKRHAALDPISDAIRALRVAIKLTDGNAKDFLGAALNAARRVKKLLEG